MSDWQKESLNSKLSTRAVEAAVTVAEAHGLECAEPIVLADRSNLIVHLHPAPVVARVATTTALVRRDAGAWLEREVAVAGFLAERGAAVVPPSDELPPGPHEHNGLALSFWKHIEYDPDRALSDGDVGRSLAELHNVLREYPSELPYLEPVLGEMPRVLDNLERSRALGPNDLGLLRGVSERLTTVLRDPLGSVQPLHGDAGASNVLVTKEGLVWTDFEDTCCGPVAWDLACLTRASSLSRKAVLAEYGDAPSQEELEPYLETRALQATVWLALLACRFPQYESRARELIDSWRVR